VGGFAVKGRSGIVVVFDPKARLPGFSIPSANL
jgi:hypothetical protein